MFGQRARELLLEVRRAGGAADALGGGGAGASLPAYNDEGVRAVVAEARALMDHADATRLTHAPDGEGEIEDPAAKAAVRIYLAAIDRNARCLLAYHMARVGRLQEVRWREGALLPPGLKDALHPREVDFFKEYAGAVTDYMAAVGMDLTSDMTPPDRLTRTVRALRDCGEIQTSSGPRRLAAGDRLTMPHVDAEPLILRGWVEDVTELG